MRKDEKELYKWLLANEKDILERLKAIYKEALEELEDEVFAFAHGDAWISQRIYQKGYQAILAAQIGDALNRLHEKEYQSIDEYLNDSYKNAFVGVAFNIHNEGIPLLMPLNEEQIVRALVTDSKIKDGLYEQLGKDMDKLKKIIANEIARGIATNMSYGEIARNIAAQMNISLKNARRIVLTEAHRIKESAAQDARLAARERGARVLKQWDATLDGKTRRTHRKLDGQIREVDEPFEVDGKKAMYPGGFGRPEEDINCRCIALTRAEWAMDEEELWRLRERAAFWGLDKASDFQDFKNKYMNAVK